jgi:hypothetical protein
MKPSSRQPGQFGLSSRPADTHNENQDEERAVTILEKFPPLLAGEDTVVSIEETSQADMRYPKQGKAATALLRKRKRQAIARSEVYYASLER